MIAAVQTYPYRTPAEPSQADSDTQPNNDEELGALRSVHRPPRALIILYLALGLLFFGFFAGIGAMTNGGLALSVTLPVGIAVFAVLIYLAMRNRRLQIDLHEGGVVVCRGRTRTITIFDDIDEVWFELDTMPMMPIAGIARIHALRLVDHSGKDHLVPVGVEGGHTVANWIIRCCSHPLSAEAHRALAAGEVLTFGSARLDARGIAIGSARSEWNTLSLVRLLPDRIAFFRGQKVIPWQTVHLDRVPHPTLFMKLIQERAKHIEDDTAWIGRI